MLYGYLNSPFVSNPFSDAAIPPTSLTSPVISGSGLIGQTLSTTNGTWSGTLPITYSYQWNRNGSIILGATFNTYTLVTADGSTSITCTVTATNAGGFASSTSNDISVAAATDADAQLFITNAAITDPTQKTAINNLVVDLKGYGIWSKMKALYPFVGGTAAQHKFNLKNPLDTDAAFRLVFNGGFTHNSNGITGNATNSFANTKFASNQFTSADTFSIATYNRIITTSGVEMGTFAPELRYIASNISGTGYFGVGNTFMSAASTNSRGFWQVNRISSSVIKAFKNSAVFVSGTTGAGVLSSLELYIGAANSNTFPANYSLANIAFSSIGSGLTDTEAANFNTAVQTFQTTLGRNV